MTATDLRALRKVVLVRFFLLLLFFGVSLFAVSGTLKYWEAWAYIITLLLPMSAFALYMLKTNPEFLERRMKTREKRKLQKIIQLAGLPLILLIYIIPALDKRHAWSNVPLVVSITALFLVLLSYLLILYVFLINSYAARVVEVEKGQKVITTGPYGIVRHPMYSSSLLFFGFTPLALGSFWGLVPALFLPVIFIVRLLDEEKELIENLGGYREYMQKVRYRLIPGIW